MAYSVTPTSGINLSTTTTTNTNSAGTAVPTFGPLGTQVFGSDGKRYVFVKAGSSLAATIAAAVDTATFVVSADTAGTYLTPNTTVASGDYLWVGKASV